MNPDDELSRGRPAYASPAVETLTGNAVSYSIKAHQDEINNSVDDKLSELFAQHDSLRANTAMRERKMQAAHDELKQEVFEYKRDILMIRVWIWFVALTAVAAGVSSTLAWIFLGGAR